MWFKFIPSNLPASKYNLSLQVGRGDHMERLSSLLGELKALSSNDLEADPDKLKNLRKQFEYALQQARAESILEMDNMELNNKLHQIEQEFNQHQTSLHALLVKNKRSAISRKGNGTKTAYSTPADSYAADISTKLVELNDAMAGRLQASERHLQGMERSVKAIDQVASRYRDFGKVSEQSKRLVAKQAEKRRRDVMMMKAAIAVFAIVCLFIFVKRTRILVWIFRLLWAVIASVFRKRPEQVAEPATANAGVKDDL